MNKSAKSISAATGLSNYAAIPQDPAKTQEMALKRAMKPKPAHKLTQPRKLRGSV